MSVKKTSILQPGLVLPLELVLRRHMRDLEQIMRHIEHMTQTACWIRQGSSDVSSSAKLDKLNNAVNQIHVEAHTLKKEWTRQVDECWTKLKDTIESSTSPYWINLMQREARVGTTSVHAWSVEVQHQHQGIQNALQSLKDLIENEFGKAKPRRILMNKISSTLVLLQAVSTPSISDQFQKQIDILPQYEKKSSVSEIFESNAVVPMGPPLVEHHYEEGTLANDIFSFTMNPQLSLDTVNEGQHEQFLGQRVTYSSTLAMLDEPMRFSIAQNVVQHEFHIEDRSRSFTSVR